MAKEPFFLSREALYIRVWETPTVRLAKEFGLSDVAIAKMCKRLDVPKPPLGYWRRIETGQKKNIPSLNKPHEKTRPGVWIYPKSEVQTLEFEDEYKKESLAIDLKVAEKLNTDSFPEIKVSASLHKPHALIVQTKKAFSARNVDSYGALRASWEEKHLALRVSRKHFQRALLIMNALIKALEKLDGKVSIEKDQTMRTEVRIDEITIKIFLSEDFKRFERELSAEEKKRRYGHDRYYYEPSGSFAFTAEGDYGTGRSWRDGKTSRVEDQLNDIVVGIFRLAEECRQKEIERKNKERRELENAVEYEKRQIIRKQELARRAFLETLSAEWRKSRDLLNFLKEFEARLTEEKGEIASDSDEAHLLEWAYGHAAQLDPISNGRTNELMQLFKKRFDDPKAEDSYEYSNLLWKLKFLNS